MSAHIAGTPVEETILTLLPMALLGAGIAAARLREAAGRVPVRGARRGRRA